VKLLRDQNLSRKLVARLEPLFPGTAPVIQIGYKRSSDSDIWAYARVNGYTIVSKDDDFRQRSLLLGAPPKVVLLRVGNVTTDHIATLITAHADRLAHFDADSEATTLVLP